MTKEKAIMEIISNAKQVEALESCIRILSGWTTLEDLVVELKKRETRLRSKVKICMMWSLMGNLA